MTTTANMTDCDVVERPTAAEEADRERCRLRAIDAMGPERYADWRAERLGSLAHGRAVLHCGIHTMLLDPRGLERRHVEALDAARLTLARVDRRLAQECP